ncbi:MAG TPA: cytochrome c5 family protein, partial [Chromatiaceae bacterium]|nr:cytochrome c5 family protein [Chromatiaceae bacterium]
MAKKTQIMLCSLTMVAALGATTAQAADDVLSRIKPVGQVNVAGKA